MKESLFKMVIRCNSFLSCTKSFYKVKIKTYSNNFCRIYRKYYNKLQINFYRKYKLYLGSILLISLKSLYLFLKEEEREDTIYATSFKLSCPFNQLSPVTSFFPIFFYKFWMNLF